MQAQDHEIRAWFGDQWGEAETDALVAAIQATGGDDEAEWVRVVAEHDGLPEHDPAEVILDAAGMRKAYVARRAHVTRRTLDAWLAENA